MLKKLATDTIDWIDQRVPLTRVWNMHLAQYPTPKNFNFWYFFFWFFSHFSFSKPNPNGYLVNNELCAIWRRCICIDRIHHA